MNGFLALGLGMALASESSRNDKSNSCEYCSLLFNTEDFEMVIHENETVKSFFVSLGEGGWYFKTKDVGIEDAKLGDCLAKIVEFYCATNIKISPAHVAYNDVDQYLVVITCPKN